MRDERLLPAGASDSQNHVLSAQRERLRDRGLLKESYFADITIFNPATIQDIAAYEQHPSLIEADGCRLLTEPEPVAEFPGAPAYWARSSLWEPAALLLKL